MKILFLTTHLNMGGIGRYVTNLACALQRRGHSVFVASSGGELEDVLRHSGVRHIFVDIRTKSELSPKIIASFSALRSFIKKERPDLMHAHTRVTQVLSALLSFFCKVPYVTTCHGFFEKRLGRRLFGCWGKSVVAISRAVKEQLLGDFRVDEKRIALIHTGIEVEKFSRDIKEEEKAEMKRAWALDGFPVVGTIGRLSPVKGQEILLMAAGPLLKDFPETKILLIGDGPDEKRLKKLSSDLHLDKSVVFVDAVKDTASALSVIDVFVLPSIREGLGLSLAEAMAAGKPCVASKVGGIESLVEDGVTGKLFKAGDPDDLARAVKYILDDKNKAEEFKNNAKKKVANEFNIDRMAEQIEKVYRLVT